MPSPHRAVVLLLAALLAMVSPGCATASQPRVADYVDLSSPHPPLDGLPDSADAVLAFALATGSACRPSWAGERPVDDPGLHAEIAGVTARGGHVVAATGGESGQYLETTCGTADALAAAFGSALDATGSTELDVDLEKAVDPDRVADALTALARRRDVALTVTLAVDDAGFDPRVTPVLDRLAQQHVPVTVNAMLIDLDPRGDYRSTLLRTAAVAHDEVTRWPGDQLALTVMAGRNDNGAVTTLDDASAVREYALEHGVSRIGLWSFARDNGGCPTRADASPGCSGVAQSPQAFALALSGTGP